MADSMYDLKFIRYATLLPYSTTITCYHSSTSLLIDLLSKPYIKPTMRAESSPKQLSLLREFSKVHKIHKKNM